MKLYVESSAETVCLMFDIPVNQPFNGMSLLTLRNYTNIWWTITTLD